MLRKGVVMKPMPESDRETDDPSYSGEDVARAPLLIQSGDGVGHDSGSYAFGGGSGYGCGHHKGGGYCYGSYEYWR